MMARTAGIRRTAAGIGLAGLVVAALAPTAAAQSEPDYPPTNPTLAAGVCVGDIPYFSYQVDYGAGGQFVGQPLTITFSNPSGEDFVIQTTVPQPGQSAQVLWPGASENPPDWPGWVLNEDGLWVESTTDPGAFTRAPGGVTVTFETNPTLSTTVVYPPATSVCANPQNPTPPGEQPPPDEQPPPPGDEVTSAGLPATGGSITAALLGGGLLAAGAGLVAVSRRRKGGAAL